MVFAFAAALLIIINSQVNNAAYALCCTSLALQFFGLFDAIFNKDSFARKMPLWYLIISVIWLTVFDAFVINSYLNAVPFATWMYNLALAEVIIAGIEIGGWIVVGCLLCCTPLPQQEISVAEALQKRMDLTIT